MRGRPFLRQRGERLPDGPVSGPAMLTSGLMMAVLTAVFWVVFALDGALGVPCRTHICTAMPGVLLVPASIAVLFVAEGVWKVTRADD